MIRNQFLGSFRQTQIFTDSYVGKEMFIDILQFIE